MTHLEEIADEVASLMNTDTEIAGETCFVKKKRNLNIYANQNYFSCVLDLDISFRKLKNNGEALNKAEILLLPEELPAFTMAWSSFASPLPVNFKQRCEANPNIVCLHLETMECPKIFSARLSAALEALKPLESIS
ncbi:hypothetical protein [Planococcus sp. CAU13]|uniref:hypothetical protein n=1 Tax=Planococcus sp. CAU13 TaxID=1541197 RepID=UPI00052FDD4D|nr:hypothetical protein [Planococcus sp. CAU13]